MTAKEPAQEELRNCPFCGSKGDISFDELDHAYVVGCSTCSGGMQCCYREKSEAIAEWNRREGEK